VPLKHVHRKYETTGFATQTGKAELYSELLHRHGYPAVPRFVEPAEQRDEAFPLTLFSANNGYFCHSQHRGINALRRKRAEPTAEIHPELARRRQIQEGDWMRVRSRIGTIRMRAAFNDALAQDVVASDYGWWQPAPDLGLPGHLPDETRPIGASFQRHHRGKWPRSPERGAGAALLWPAMLRLTRVRPGKAGGHSPSRSAARNVPMCSRWHCGPSTAARFRLSGRANMSASE